MKPALIYLFFIVGSGICVIVQAQEVAEELLTVAERSGWRATSTHAEVLQLVLRLANRSPLIHVEEAGSTFEKKVLPIMVIADPPVTDPTQVGNRLVAFAWAGIHSGEVCGKPATLMLARELATTNDHPLGTLAAYLLEPQSEDGFCAWNFLEDELTVGSDVPMLRLPKPTTGL